jgi:uncharacterized coiled-coil DUF342 family protein
LHEQEERIHKRQITDQIAAAKGFHSEKESLQSRVHVLEEDIRITNRRKDELVEENQRLKKELDKTISRMEESTHQYKYHTNNIVWQ